jgi:hypothetical protein
MYPGAMKSPYLVVQRRHSVLEMPRQGKNGLRIAQALSDEEWRYEILG